jgi:hypothetical protein
MAPLDAELYDAKNIKWVTFGILNPGDRPASMSDNKPDGRRDVYMIECSPDDTHSTIYRSKAGLDIIIGNLRVVAPLEIPEGFEIVKILKKGDEPYVLSLKTDKSPEERKVSFTHK